MKKKIFVIAAFLSYQGMYSHAAASDADTAFKQPISVKYHFSEDLRGGVFKKVVVDYNDIVYVLTNEALCRATENEVVKDLLYRPLADKIPVDVTTQEMYGVERHQWKQVLIGRSQPWSEEVRTQISITIPSIGKRTGGISMSADS